MLTEEKVKHSVTVERTISAPAAAVYRAFTNEVALRDWLCNAASVDPRPGGRIYLWWDGGYYSSGVYSDLDRNKSIVFTWRGPDDAGAGEVHVTLTPKGEDETHVTLTRIGVDAEHGDETTLGSTQSWESALESLEHVLETGIDLRIARRPMFGVTNAGDLNDELIDKLGLSISQGLWIGGVVDGMGAQEAGLQKDDVVVRVDDHPIAGFTSFGSAMQAHQAGDQVEIEFYRGAESHTAITHLSKRPTPDLPATQAALLEKLSSTYAELNAELDAIVAGVTEEEAGYHPGDEWSAKEILAHLIASEYDTQTWIYTTVGDKDAITEIFGNEPGRIHAIAGAFGTVPALVEQLKRCGDVTQAQAADIPAETQARKHQYNVIVGWLTSFQDHRRGHYAEMADRIKAARDQTSA
jgi:uncharacterized protein YndB with AHSA1/START domain